MTVPDERELRKQFIAVRNRLTGKYVLSTHTKTDLHSILFQSCMTSVEDNILHAVKCFNNLIGENTFPAATLENLMETARLFKNNPSVVASLFELKPDIEVKQDGSKYGEQHGERRRAGRFFTPLKIAGFMANLLLDEYFKSNDNRNLKILDPSTGAGIFLDVIYSELEKRNFTNAEILNSLYGVDLDLNALMLSKRILKTKSSEQNIMTDKGLKPLVFKPLVFDLMSYQDDHFHQGDFLLGDLNHPDGGYDLIIGNPPYIAFYSRESHIDTDELKSRMIKRYHNSGGGSANTFLYFLIRSIELLKDNGMLCFIIPDKLLWNKRYHRIRKYILDNAPPRMIFNVGENVFSGATVGNVIILLEKSSQISHAEGSLFATPVNTEKEKVCTFSKLTLDNRSNSFRITEKKKVPVRNLAKQKDFRFVITDMLSEKIAANSIPLKEIAHVKDGINPAFAEFRNSVLATTKRSETYRPLIEGADISPFNLKPRDLFINYDISLVTSDLQKRGVSFRKEWIFTAPLKLVNRQTADRLIFALDENKHCSLNSVHNTILKDDCIAKINLDINTNDTKKAILYFLLGALNSRLMNYYYRSVTQETAKAFPQVHIADLNELPIRLPDIKQLAKIAHCVELILNSNRDSTVPLNALDDLIFSLYGMNQKERDKIISATNPEWRN